MRRRSVLAGAGALTSAAAASVSAPAIARGMLKLKMVTDWPARSKGLQSSAERLAQAIHAASDGRIAVEVFPANTLVKALETFDAVGAGVADMYHSAEYYWEQKSSAFTFFTTVPFGLSADELFAWVHYGGGQELWDTLSAQFNIKPLLCLNTGVQMGGWFNGPLASLGDFKGLRYRMPGQGGEVLRRLGATVVNLPGGDIVQALRSGAIDASEWVGPWMDMDLGLHRVASHYYYPGFHEPGTGLAVGINRRLWESIAVSDRRLIEDAAAAEYARGVAEFSANNAWCLRTLREEGAVKITRFDDSMIKAFLVNSKDVVAQAGTGDDLSRKIYASYHAFRTAIMDWSDIAERAYLNSRGLE
ncbi:TRAP transporter substrate-binding protein [Vineibacter terrae]|uniref:TRAP transporter substrate-binding protein n=1 Tax=Vineibacter terrae TaxID=2586908 RepID=UPI002E34108B|nr:TRAP transporter substrate-binding protein [Vineibacter terrae]HEX2891235.1 TRAP transporter substrate-binding protein [Vineibacter terrae]